MAKEDEVVDTTPEAQDTTPAAASAPAPEPTPEPVAQEPAPQPTPAEQWEDIRDFAKGHGLDISHIDDPQAAAKYLVDMARNNNAYAQYGQQLAPYYSEIQRFLSQRQQGGQQAPTPAAATEAKRYFDLPEFDPQWLDWLERDAAGNVVPKVGAPPDVVGKVVQYQKALANFQNQFYQKPEQFLQPLIQDAVQPLVQQAIQQNLKTYQDSVYATNWIAQNTNWLHYHDGQGNVIRDPVTGAYAMTPEGQLFTTHLRRAEQVGIRDLQAQQQYAMDQMRLAYFAQQATQAQAVNTSNQKNQQFLQDRNRRAPNSAGSINAGPGVSQNKELSLSERLRNALTTNGISDAALVADVR
jgi:hypothetical protein